MLGVPIQVNARRVLILILEQENVVRMQQGDPIDLKLDDYFIPQMNAHAPELLIAYEQDRDKIVRMMKEQGVAEVVKYLERGRTIYDGERVGGGIPL